MKHFLHIILLTLGLSAMVQAQDTSQTRGGGSLSRYLWEADLPGGNYMVALDHICSINIHSYVITGGAIVHEVNIDTNGNALVRFYTIEIVGQNSKLNLGKNVAKRGQEIIGEQSKRVTGLSANTIVEKQYPVTTHAKTIEYRLASKSDLDALYASVKKAWTQSRGNKFTIKP